MSNHTLKSVFYFSSFKYAKRQVTLEGRTSTACMSAPVAGGAREARAVATCSKVVTCSGACSRRRLQAHPSEPLRPGQTEVWAVMCVMIGGMMRLGVGTLVLYSETYLRLILAIWWANQLYIACAQP